MTSTFRSDLVDTQYIEGRSSRFAYRRFGVRSEVPLVMALRFRGTIDHWDPALLDVLGSERDVIVFDNVGTGRSTGAAPNTIFGMAAGLLEFVDALGLARFDLFGWSLGGIVVQAAALQRPDLVRRMVVAGSTPGGVPDMPAPPEKAWQVALKPVNDDEDFLYLFFPESPVAREAGIASLRRLRCRLDDDSHAAVSPEAVSAQFDAANSLGAEVWQRLTELTLPVLVANGAHDVMVSAYASYAMSQRLPNAKVILYSDAGHGFLFQHVDEFGREVLKFLH